MKTVTFKEVAINDVFVKPGHGVPCRKIDEQRGRMINPQGEEGGFIKCAPDEVVNVRNKVPEIGMKDYIYDFVAPRPPYPSEFAFPLVPLDPSGSVEEIKGVLLKGGLIDLESAENFKHMRAELIFDTASTIKPMTINRLYEDFHTTNPDYWKVGDKTSLHNELLAFLRRGRHLRAVSLRLQSFFVHKTGRLEPDRSYFVNTDGGYSRKAKHLGPGTSMRKKAKFRKHVSF